MTTAWLFRSTSSTGATPLIRDQLISVDNHLLILRNPWIKDSVFMGKMYTGGTLLVMVMTYSIFLDPDYWRPENFSMRFFLMFLTGPLFSVPFLIYRLVLIKNISHFYFNRATQKIHYRYYKTHAMLDWNRTEGGVLSIGTEYPLAFAERRNDNTLPKRFDFWIDTNQPTDPGAHRAAEVWEYVRHFMAHGPGKLPASAESSWWHAPLHCIYLTPAQAWRHYVPWRTGEPGEAQGKKNWMLPLWLILLPYNLATAICWYWLCQLFGIRPATPLLESLINKG